MLKIDLSELVRGDMPGDQIQIEKTHILRAEVIFPVILQKLKEAGKDKTVISVYGGSGVGKSEIASLLAHYLKQSAYQTYVLSGDNYPRRIPEHNDGERLNRFRSAGLSAMAQENEFTSSWDRDIHDAWEDLKDADPEKARAHRGFQIYQEAGKLALRQYLGSEMEIDFNLINHIITQFKGGSTSIPLKRMGRMAEDVHFESVDFSKKSVLIIEWTHGNNPALKGIDYPVYLYSTPDETLAHRLSRGRDKRVDSPFSNMVLEIEQERLNSQCGRASLIIGKSGEILSIESLQKRMTQ
ncbi:MAG: hypothetical protein B6241_05725 [Spirochaetaceae bacterium 4572_59]|nr:MAG: hypothetical protein B6241_05725 [Spirochaetaceae bacterium 4572_59]